MKNIFLRLYQKLEEKPLLCRLLLFTLIGLFSGALFFAHFSEDISSFLPENEQNKRINEAYQHLNTTNKIVVFLSAKDTTKDVKDDLISIAEEFVDLLKKNDSNKLTNNIFYKVTESNISEISDFIVDNVHLFMKEKDYMRIDSLLIDENKMFSELVWTQQLLNSPSNVMLQNMLVNDPIHISNTILKRLNDCQQENSFSHYNGYVFDSKGKEILITLTSATPASETQKNKEWIKTIQKTTASIEDNHKGEIQITHIGASNISIGNAEQIKKDSIITSVVALLLIAALLFFYFRDVRAIGLILASILFGALAALALLALFKDEISIIAVGVGSIIVGIAANYPLHFLSHLQEKKSSTDTLKDLSMPLIVGNITTVGAFLSLLFINSSAMKDMGLFSAILLVGTIAFVLIFLPHFCKKVFNRQNEGGDREIPFFSHIAKFAPEENKYIVLSVFIGFAKSAEFSRFFGIKSHEHHAFCVEHANVVASAHYEHRIIFGNLIKVGGGGKTFFTFGEIIVVPAFADKPESAFFIKMLKSGAHFVNDIFNRNRSPKIHGKFGLNVMEIVHMGIVEGRHKEFSAAIEHFGFGGNELFSFFMYGKK